MKRSLFYSVISAAIIFIAFAFTAAAYTIDGPAVSQTENSVSLWTQRNYGGRCLELGPGEYPEISLRPRSIYVPFEYVVTAYSGKDFTGTEYRLIESEPSFFRFDFGKGFTYIKGIRSLKIELIESEKTDITDIDDALKNQMLLDYAPEIILAKDDPYEPVSLEFVFDNFYVKKDSDGVNRIYTYEEPTGPFQILDVYRGDIETSKAYAFWVEKDDGYIDLVYFQFCAFDSGKMIHIIRHMAGGHPGDWEHFTIRFMTFSENGRRYMRPVKAAFPAHTFAALQSWEDLEKYDATHPRIYCAYGTHGMYPHVGEYCYMNLAPIERLVDVCTEGESWKIWEEGKTETFEHTVNESCLALAGSPWAHVFGYDCEGEGAQGIRFWGNEAYFTPFLNSGPEGPQFKTEMSRPDILK